MRYTIKKLVEKVQDRMQEIADKDYFSDIDQEDTKHLAKAWLYLDDILARIKDEPMLCGCNPNNTEYLTDFEIKEWNCSIINQDGSKGGKWGVEQTNDLAQKLGVEFTHITPCEFNVTCNMIYSDYEKVAKDFCLNAPEFYGKMACAFLFDVDGKPPRKKLADYYRFVVK